jgi:hypothetical protein
MIQCQSDLSPVPVHVEKEIRINGSSIFIAQGAEHTCRKFDNVLEWLEERERIHGAIGEFPGIKGNIVLGG